MSKQSELDEILGQAFYIEDGEYIGSYQEDTPIGFDIKQALLDWHNKQIEQAYSDGFRKASKGAFKSQQEAKREAVEEVLDRLEVKLSHFGHDATVNIEAERNKLKESSNE